MSEGSNNIKEFDVIIVGGGVSGTSLLFTLSKFTNVKKIALLEKHRTLGSVASDATQNSQTLHFGDIETNYSLEKSKSVKKNADMLKNFIEKNKSKYKGLFSIYPKMVIAVGDKEVAELSNRYEQFKDVFPNLRKIDRSEIQKIEPHVIKGRPVDEPIIALFSDEGYTVDFGNVARAFAEESKKEDIEIFNCTSVKKLSKLANGNYLIETNKESFSSPVVIFAAGGYSLYFAHKLGLGKEFALLSVSGSFFLTPKVMNGKVYTLQNPKLPFAAIHGDAEVHYSNWTRFGPTAKPIFMLERYNYSSALDYFKVLGFGWRQIHTLIKLHQDVVVFKYVFRNFLYELPLLGKRLFIKDVRKIVPSTKISDLKRAKGFGGTRPQILNLKTRKLDLGESRVVGSDIIFNITPSPGASTCLGNAYRDVQTVIDMLDKKGHKYSFDKVAFDKEFVSPSRLKLVQADKA